MNTNRYLLILCGGLFVSFLPSTVVAQSHDVENQIYEAYVEHAERVEVGGVEFKGYKTGVTKFRKCNGEVIDIGNKTPKRSGPCPSDGKPRQIFAFEVEILGIDPGASMMQVRAADGKIYDWYFPEESKEIVTQSRGIGGGAQSGIGGGAQSGVAGVAKGNGQVMFGIHAPGRTTLSDLKLQDLKSGSKITIVSILEGRAEAIMRPQN